jgi:hypothetical protein
VRFQDFNREVCELLKLEEEQRRQYRPVLLRCHGRGMSLNATLAWMRQVMAEKVMKPSAPGATVAGAETPGESADVALPKLPT